MLYFPSRKAANVLDLYRDGASDLIMTSCLSFTNAKENHDAMIIGLSYRTSSHLLGRLTTCNWYYDSSSIYLEL